MQNFDYGFLVDGNKGLFFASDNHLYFQKKGVVILKKVLSQI